MDTAKKLQFKEELSKINMAKPLEDYDRLDNCFGIDYLKRYSSQSVNEHRSKITAIKMFLMAAVNIIGILLSKLLLRLGILRQLKGEHANNHAVQIDF